MDEHEFEDAEQLDQAFVQPSGALARIQAISAAAVYEERRLAPQLKMEICKRDQGNTGRKRHLSGIWVH